MSHRDAADLSLSNISESLSSGWSTLPLVTPPPPTNINDFTIVRNVGGIKGLSVAYNLFSETAEADFFSTPLPNKREDNSGRAGELSTYEPSLFPTSMWPALNAVRDSGLCAEMLDPDYVFALAYGRRDSFHAHFDSRYRWGEHVVGICLGAPAEICFYESTLSHHAGNDLAALAAAGTVRAIRIILPRRSAYSMADDSRTKWQHSVQRVGYDAFGKLETVPSWNILSERRSWTFRATKVYGLESLRRSLSECAPEDSIKREAFNARIRAQMILKTTAESMMNWPPQSCKDGKSLNKGEIEEAAKEARGRLDEISREPLLSRRALRLKSSDALFLTPSTLPSIRSLYEKNQKGMGIAEAGAGAGASGAGVVDDDDDCVEVDFVSSSSAGGAGSTKTGAQTISTSSGGIGAGGREVGRKAPRDESENASDDAAELEEALALSRSDADLARAIAASLQKVQPSLVVDLTADSEDDDSRS